MLTISLETGFQNVYVPFLIIMLNFPSPEADYALLPLIAVTALTGVPLWISLFLKIAIYWFDKITGRGSSDLPKMISKEPSAVAEKEGFIASPSI